MKTNSFLLFIGALLLTAACRQEPAPQQTVTVTFQLGLPEDTRAAGDGSQATSLTLRIYDADGQFLQAITGNSFTPSVTLVPGTYSFCFWATSPDADAYSFDGQFLTIDYTKMTMNSDMEDAFWACVPDFAVTQDFSNKPVQLSRPLGQVSLYSKDSNLALTAADLGDATKYVSKFTLQGPAGSGIPTQLNLLTGATAAPVSQVTFPDSPLQQPALESSATDGTLLAFAYVLAPETALTLSQVDFSATLKRTQATLASGSASSVPLQRNHRTRLVSQPQQTQLAPPTISITNSDGGPQDALDENHNELWVSIQAAQGTTIYYSVDGTTPTENSLQYDGPFSVTKVCTIQAIAVKSGCISSDVVTAVTYKSVTLDGKTLDNNFNFTGYYEGTVDNNVSYYTDPLGSNNLSMLVSGEMTLPASIRLHFSAQSEYEMVLIIFYGEVDYSLSSNCGQVEGTGTGNIGDDDPVTWTGNSSHVFFHHPVSVNHIKKMTVKYTKVSN